MKKTLVILLILVTQISISSAQYYNFSASAATYQELSGNTVLTSASWGDDSYEKNLGISFKFFGKSYDTLIISTQSGFWFTEFGDDFVNAITAELKEHNSLESNVSFLVEGTSPNRIVKIQWKNVGFGKDMSQTAYANLQAWLYESSGNLEFYFGGSSGINPSLFLFSNPLFSISNEDDSKTYALSGDPANPTLNFNPSSTVTLNGFPANGTKYSFEPTAISTLKKIQAQSTPIKVYPNPTRGMVNLNLGNLVVSNGKIEITNPLGQVVFSQDISAENTGSLQQIDFSAFGKGLYIIKVETTEMSQKTKLLVN